MFTLLLKPLNKGNNMLNKGILNRDITRELIENLYYASPALLSEIIKDLSIETFVKSDIDNIKIYCSKSLPNTINVLSSINNQNK